jgi:putative transposase
MERVREFPTRFGVEVHAFVLMPNHYHLLLRTPRGNLSRAVQWLNTGYAIWWNGRHGRHGRVFQGRFKHVVVEEGDWLVELSLYLHLNPLAEKRLLKEDTGGRAPRRLEILRSWRWSSYRAYAGLQEPSNGLTVSNILNRVPGRRGGISRARRGPARPGRLLPPGNSCGAAISSAAMRSPPRSAGLPRACPVRRRRRSVPCGRAS